MHEHDPLTHAIIGHSIEVHRHLGPGLLEATYEEALTIELSAAGLSYARQVGVPVLYKGHLIGEHRPDLVIEGRVIVEIKSVFEQTCGGSLFDSRCLGASVFRGELTR